MAEYTNYHFLLQSHKQILSTMQNLLKELNLTINEDNNFITEHIDYISKLQNDLTRLALRDSDMESITIPENKSGCENLNVNEIKEQIGQLSFSNSHEIHKFFHKLFQIGSEKEFSFQNYKEVLKTLLTGKLKRDYLILEHKPFPEFVKAIFNKYHEPKTFDFYADKIMNLQRYKNESLENFMQRYEKLAEKADSFLEIGEKQFNTFHGKILIMKIVIGLPVLEKFISYLDSVKEEDKSNDVSRHIEYAHSLEEEADCFPKEGISVHPTLSIQGARVTIDDDESYLDQREILSNSTQHSLQENFNKTKKNSKLSEQNSSNSLKIEKVNRNRQDSKNEKYSNSKSNFHNKLENKQSQPKTLNCAKCGFYKHIPRKKQSNEHISINCPYYTDFCKTNCTCCLIQANIIAKHNEHLCRKIRPKCFYTSSPKRQSLFSKNNFPNSAREREKNTSSSNQQQKSSKENVNENQSKKKKQTNTSHNFTEKAKVNSDKKKNPKSVFLNALSFESNLTDVQITSVEANSFQIGDNVIPAHREMEDFKTDKQPFILLNFITSKNSKLVNHGMFDTGCSATLISLSFLRKFPKKIQETMKKVNIPLLTAKKNSQSTIVGEIWLNFSIKSNHGDKFPLHTKAKFFIADNIRQDIYIGSDWIMNENMVEYINSDYIKFKYPEPYSFPKMEGQEETKTVYFQYFHYLETAAINSKDTIVKAKATNFIKCTLEKPWQGITVKISRVQTLDDNISNNISLEFQKCKVNNFNEFFVKLLNNGDKDIFIKRESMLIHIEPDYTNSIDNNHLELDIDTSPVQEN